MKRPVDSAKKGVDLGRWGYKTTRMGKILILGCPPPPPPVKKTTTPKQQQCLKLYYIYY